VALAEHQRILAPIERLAGFPANPVADLIAHNGAQWNQEQELRDMNLSRGGEDAGRDEQGITG
jgi:hypothetical protein